MTRTIILIAATLLVLGTAAHAESIACEKSETHAACFARLRCKPNEKLEDCQSRIAKCTADARSLETCKKEGQPAGDQRDHTDQRDDDRNTREREREPDRERDPDRNRSDNAGGSRRTRPRQHRGRAFEANKTFGVGLELGEPSGLNGKVFVGKSSAIDFGLGYIYDSYYYGDGVHLYADYLWHPMTIASTPSFELPFYIGVGVRFWDFRYCVGKVCTFDGSTFGVRIPLGIAFDFNNVPLDLFIQLVPVLDFVRGDYYDRFHDRAHFGVDFSVGVRFWFR